MDQKFKLGGTIGYGDAYFEFIVCRSKVFRLRAILHDATGAVRAHSGKGPGYCYMIGRGPNSCLLGLVTALVLPLRKTLSASHFQLCRLLKQYVLHCTRYWACRWKRYLGVRIFQCWQISGIVIWFSKKVQTHKARIFGLRDTCTELCGTVDVWITVSCQTFFLEIKMVTFLQKEQKTVWFLPV